MRKIKKYKVEYTITGKVKPSTAFTQGTLTYELFRTTQKVETPVSCPEPSATADGNEVHYTRICNNDAKLSEAVSLTTGTGDATSAEDAFTYKDEIIADGNTTYYYYLVVTYQSKEEDQSDDATKSVTLSIDSVTANNTSSVS